MADEAKKTQTITILQPAFYTLQSTICWEWHAEFIKKAALCREWVEMFEKTINKGAEFTEKYREWEIVFSNQARVCAQQAEMCAKYANDAKL